MTPFPSCNLGFKSLNTVSFKATASCYAPLRFKAIPSNYNAVGAFRIANKLRYTLYMQLCFSKYDLESKTPIYKKVFLMNAKRDI